jgi:cytochrome c-type biogenesis protein CcmH
MTARLPTTLALLLVLLATAGVIPASSLAVTPRTSLTDIEPDVMCVSCREPLALAQSPQAIAERNYISELVQQGLTKKQIEQALVGQYGLAVLGRPPAHGFNLTVYILPPALLLAGVAILAIYLPRWRRRTRAASTTALPHGPALDAGDARRLDEDLARYG